MMNLLSGFSAEAPVLTRRGLIPISEVTTSDMVLTHEARWQAVTATETVEADTLQLGHILTAKGQQFLTSALKTHWQQNPLRLTKHLTDPTWNPTGKTTGALLAHLTRVPATEENLPRVSYETIGKFLAGSKDHLTVREEKALLPLLTDKQTLPGWVFSLSTLKREIILDTYLSTASHRGDRRQVITRPAELHQTSTVQLLAETLGWQTHLNQVGNLWNLTLRKATQDTTDAAYRATHYRWMRQNEKAIAGKQTALHNLTVAEDNSYIAWGLVVAGKPA